MHSHTRNISQSIALCAGILWPALAGGQTFTITSSSGTRGSIVPAGEVRVNKGAHQAYSIHHEYGYHLDSLVVDGEAREAESDSEYTFTNVSFDHTIRATFEPDESIVTADADANSSITPQGNKSMRRGSEIKYSISAKKGYVVDSVVVDGIYVGALTSYTFENISYDHSIRVVSKAKGKK